MVYDYRPRPGKVNLFDVIKLGPTKLNPKGLEIKLINSFSCAGRDFEGVAGERRFFVKAPSDEEQEAQLEKEVLCLGELETPGHDHILTKHTAVTYNDERLLIFPFLEGHSLENMVLPVAEVVAIGIAMCSALGYAHSKKWAHADVKPENIFKAEKAILTDFGIAKKFDNGNLFGTLSGTRLYMAPETWLQGKYSPRTDLYLLGGTLFSLLVGRPMFHGKGGNIGSLHCSEYRPDVRKFNNEIPDALAKIVSIAVSSYESDRFRDMAEMEQALKSVQTSFSVQAPRPAYAPAAKDSPHISQKQ